MRERIKLFVQAKMLLVFVIFTAISNWLSSAQSLLQIQYPSKICPGTYIGEASNAQAISLNSQPLFINGAYVGVRGSTASLALAFVYNGSSPSVSTVSWIVATNDGNFIGSALKMVLLTVTVSSGQAYVCSIEAGYISSSTLLTSSLTSTYVNSAWIRRTFQVIASSSTTTGYGVSTLSPIFATVSAYDISGIWVDGFMNQQAITFSTVTAITFSTATATGTGMWMAGSRPPFTIMKTSTLNVYSVNFPDSGTYQATVVFVNTIRWGNGGVWTRTSVACINAGYVSYSSAWKNPCCHAGYFYQNVASTFCYNTCPDGYYADSNSICQVCAMGCASCSSYFVCTACSSGYYFSGSTCVVCAMGCASCSSSFVCTACSSGYYFSGSTCVGCPTSCSACTSSTTCTLCSVGYALSSGVCSRTGPPVGVIVAVVILSVVVCAGICCFLYFKKKAGLAPPFQESAMLEITLDPHAAINSRESEQKESVALEIRLEPDAATISSESEEKESLAIACIICMENPKNILLLPCKHMCICKQCYEQSALTLCPICRGEVRSFMEIYS